MTGSYSETENIHFREYTNTPILEETYNLTYI